MKKLLLCAAFAVFGLTKINAQENSIKANPLALLGGTDLISYERAFGENTSGVISAAYGGFKLGDIKYTSVGGALQYRYYFSEVFDGWYGAGVASVQSGKTKFEDSVFGGGSNQEFNFTAVGGGVKFGHQWLWDSGFTLDLNLGASYVSFSYDYDDNTSNTTVDLLKGSGVLPTFGFALGYTW